MKKTIINYFFVISGSAFARGVAFVNSIIIARFLGPKQFGLFSIYYVVMILTWQIPQAFDTTFIRYAKSNKCQITKAKYLSSTIFLKILYLVAILLIMHPLSIFLSTKVFNKPEIYFFLILALISGAFLSFLMTIASIFQEQEKFFHFSVLNAFYTVAIFVFLIFLKLFQAKVSLNIVVMGYFIITSLIGIISLFLLLRRTSTFFVFDWKILKMLVGFGKWILGVTCVFFIFQRIDILFLTRFALYENIGIYSVATQLILFVSLLTGSLANISLPKACKAITSRSGLIGFIKESLFAVFFINLFVGALIFSAPFLIKLVYGPEYIGAVRIAQILLFGWFFGVIFIPFSFLFYSLDDSRTRFLLESLKLIIGAIFLSIFLPEKGMVGAALAIAIALVSSTFISMIVLFIKIRKQWRGLPHA